ncbi:MAG: HAMP domain-containing protein [Burkholderiales bacterium]|nr:HAMP domain-containing protein [Burkholderiales bacterium]
MWSWRRFDTLFVRLFLLMWVTLVASHFVAFFSVVNSLPPRPATPALGSAPGPRPAVPHPGGTPPMPTFPSLPPGNPFVQADPQAHPGRPGLPRGALWLDYGLRMLVIGLGAALGARWLSAPMRRLSRASATLTERLAQGKAMAPLDEPTGTREVRDAAAVFNHMAARLRAQFDARGLHMAAVSHDLRTPLTRLRMRLEQSPDVAMSHAAIADIREMDALIGSTLAVLREQRDDSAARTVDLAALLQAVVDDLVEQGQHASIPHPLPPLRVSARPAALRRIVGNLAGNALRYGGRVRITLLQGADGWAEILVDDDGPGIPPAQLARAFQPWVRLDDGASSDGHGLGLAIARDLAERDGGQLTLRNRFEGGLRAELRLPVV